MTSHKAFTVSSMISLMIVTVIIILYDYYLSMRVDDIHLRFILKPIPISVMIVNVMVYMFIYRMHVYAMLIGGSLLFCLLGDILLMFYIPPIPQYDNILFLIVGGISFFIGRVIMSLAMGVYPYRNNKEKCLKATIKKVVLVGIIAFIYTVGMSIYFDLTIDQNIVMKILLPIYFTSMGMQFFLSLLRVKGFDDETLRSQLLGFVGTLLFNISDSILFWTIFISPISYGDIISISIYWVSMYLITISVVRSKTYESEKDTMSDYLHLSTNEYYH